MSEANETLENATRPEPTDGAVELAERHGIDLGGVEGTGEDGRVTKADVQKLVPKGGPEPTVKVMPNPSLGLDSVRFGEDEVYRKGDAVTAEKWAEIKEETDPARDVPYLVEDNEGGNR